ncbi:MAG: response regulator [Geminicoccaceae bacterium]
MQGTKVLIVEDEPLIAILLEGMLADLGIRVTDRAATLDEARDAARRDGFGAAILDINLHGRMSYSAAEELARRGVPIVLVSGYAPEGVPPTLADAVLVPKPYQAEQIASALTRVLDAGSPGASGRRPRSRECPGPALPRDGRAAGQR